MGNRSPLEELHRNNGARFGEDHEWSLPLHFGATLEEYQAVRSKVGLMDLCDRSLIRLTGDDRVSFLQGLVSNDVTVLTPGHGILAAFVDIHGKILADTKIFGTEDSLFLDLWEPLKEKILAHLEHFLIADDVEITDLTGTIGILSLQGPKSTELLEKLLETKTLPSEELSHGEFQTGAHRFRLTRATHTGETGFDLWVATRDIRALALSIQEKGTVFSIQWTGTQAQEVLRIETGIPRYGVDMDSDNLLLETGLDHAVSFEKGCYLGQEIMERIQSRGHVNKRLVGMILEGDEPAQQGDRIEAEKKEVGRVTSSIFSPRLRSPVALGYVQRDYFTPGTRLIIWRDGKALPSMVSPLPFKS